MNCELNDMGESVTLPSAFACSQRCDEIVSCVAVVYVESSQSCVLKHTCDTGTLQTVDEALGTNVYVKTGIKSIPIYRNVLLCRCNYFPTMGNSVC